MDGVFSGMHFTVLSCAQKGTPKYMSLIWTWYIWYTVSLISKIYVIFMHLYVIGFRPFYLYQDLLLWDGVTMSVRTLGILFPFIDPHVRDPGQRSRITLVKKKIIVMFIAAETTGIYTLSNNACISLEICLVDKHLPILIWIIWNSFASSGTRLWWIWINHSHGILRLICMSQGTRSTSPKYVRCRHMQFTTSKKCDISNSFSSPDIILPQNHAYSYINYHMVFNNFVHMPCKH